MSDCLRCKERTMIRDLMLHKRKSVDLDGSREAARTYCSACRMRLAENLRILRKL